MMKAVHFGAGNIGRGFIGLVLSTAGYHVTFVDVQDDVVAYLSRHNSYTVTLANEARQQHRVTGVTAVHGRETDTVVRHIAQARIVTTAIGAENVGRIAATIAAGIRQRAKMHNELPLLVIACENGVNIGSRLQRDVYDHLPSSVVPFAETVVAFPNAMVDRIVPEQRVEHPGHVTVEPYYEWTIVRPGSHHHVPDMPGVHFVDDLRPHIARKLFTVNTGHSIAAYVGWLRGHKTIHQALADAYVKKCISGALDETTAVLKEQYGLERDYLKQYVTTTLNRFRNPLLQDGIRRIGRAPMRKLARDERLVSPALLLHQRGERSYFLAKAIGAAFHFDANDDADALHIQRLIQRKGIEHAITRVTSLPVTHPLHQSIATHYKKWTKKRNPPSTH